MPKGGPAQNRMLLFLLLFTAPDHPQLPQPSKPHTAGGAGTRPARLLKSGAFVRIKCYDLLFLFYLFSKGSRKTGNEGWPQPFLLVKCWPLQHFSVGTELEGAPFAQEQSRGGFPSHSRQLDKPRNSTGPEGPPRLAPGSVRGLWQPALVGRRRAEHRGLCWVWREQRFRASQPAFQCALRIPAL